MCNDLTSDEKNKRSSIVNYPINQIKRSRAVKNCKINLSFETCRARDRTGAISNPLESIFLTEDRTERTRDVPAALDVAGFTGDCDPRHTRQCNKLFATNTNNSTYITRTHRTAGNDRRHAKSRSTNCCFYHIRFFSYFLCCPSARFSFPTKKRALSSSFFDRFDCIKLFAKNTHTHILML